MTIILPAYAAGKIIRRGAVKARAASGGRFAGRFGFIGFEPLERHAQGGDFRFEQRHALNDFIGAVRGLDGARAFDKVETDLVVAPPLHPRAQRLVALRDVKLENIGKRHGVGKDDAGTLLRQIADQTSERTALAADINEAAQKALAASRYAAFAHYSSRVGAILSTVLPRFD